MSPSPSLRSRPSSSSVLRGRMTRILAVLHVAALLALLARHGDEREAMAVGRHQAHRIGPQHQERAVEEVARVLSRDRELRLRHHLLDDVARERRDDLAAGVGQRREILARQRLHARVESIGGHLHAAFVLFDAHVRFRQRLHDLVQLLRRECQRTALGDRRSALAPEADLEIRREKLHLVPGRLEQHVRENRNRVLALDDALEELQLAQ